MGNAIVEGGVEHLARPLRHGVLAEIMPKPERDRRQLQAAPPGLAIVELLVAVARRHIGHGMSLDCSQAAARWVERAFSSRSAVAAAAASRIRPSSRLARNGR